MTKTKKNNNQDKTKWKYIVPFTLAFIFMVTGVEEYKKANNFLDNTEETNATVVGFGPKGGRRSVAPPIIELTTKQNQRIKTVLGNMKSKTYMLSEKVEVVYNTIDPRQVIVKGGWISFSFYLLLSLIVVSFFVGCFFYIKSKK